MSGALITGASGFIGRRLGARLAEDGVAVTALARSPGRGPWRRAVALDLEAGRIEAGVFEGVEVIYHLAGRTHAVADTARAQDEYERANVAATRALLAAAAGAGVQRFVFASSVKAMGEGGDALLDETAEPRPTSPYGQTKLAAEREVLAWGRAPGRHACVLRLPLVYGPGVKGNLASMLRAIDRGRFPPLAVTGNRRSMVHVDDVAAALRLVAGEPRAAGRVYLVTDGEAYSTWRIYAAMCRALGRAVPRWRVPVGLLRAAALGGDLAARVLGRRVGFDSAALDKLLGSAWYNCARLRQDTGFAPAYDLEQGLPAMVQAYRAGNPP